MHLQIICLFTFIHICILNTHTHSYWATFIHTSYLYIIPTHTHKHRSIVRCMHVCKFICLVLHSLKCMCICLVLYSYLINICNCNCEHLLVFVDTSSQVFVWICKYFSICLQINCFAVVCYICLYIAVLLLFV